MFSELENLATFPKTITQRETSQASLSLWDPPEVILILSLPLGKLIHLWLPDIGQALPSLSCFPKEMLWGRL